MVDYSGLHINELITFWSLVLVGHSRDKVK